MQREASTYRRLTFIGALAGGILIRLYLILSSSPLSDVPYVGREGVETLLRLENPYSHIFTTVPHDLQTRGGEGVFAYLPFIAIYLTPFYLLGDVRFGGLFADMVIAGCIYYVSKKLYDHHIFFTPLVYLYLPPMILLTSIYGNNTMIPSALIMLTLVLWLEERATEAGVVYGLALSSSQLTFLTFPIVIHYASRQRWRRLPIISISIFLALILPFFLASPQDMVYDVLAFQFTRETNPFLDTSAPFLVYNFGLTGIFQYVFGVEVPTILRIAIVLPILILFFKRNQTFEQFLINCGVFASLAIFIIPNNIFFTYFAIPIPILITILPKAERSAIHAHLHR